MIKVLHFISNISIRSGIISVIKNYYMYMDRSQIKFSIIYFDDRENDYSAEFQKLGVSLIKINRKSLVKDWYHFCKLHIGEYDILHNHELFLSGLFFNAKKTLGVKKIISHVHATKYGDTKLKAIRNAIFSFPSRWISDYILACSKEAGLSLMRQSFKGKGVVLKNAIQIEKFKFNLMDRKIIRNQLCITSENVIGHVCNMTPPKNHFFLLNLFYEYKKQNENSVLLLVGDGYLREDLKQFILSKGLTDSVVMVGTITEVNKYLSAMDVFVFPSNFEGLGIALIEAQANGLPCIYSNKVPEEANIIKEYNTCLSLNSDIDLWIHAINEAKRSTIDRTDRIRQAGYDIQKEAENLNLFYERVIDCHGIYK